MTNAVLELFIVTVVVVTDNALLAGLLLPHGSRTDKFSLTLIVAVLLAAAEVGFAIGADQLLQWQVFRYSAILVLIWMSIQTLNLSMARGGGWRWTTLIRVFAYTCIGNIDNLIWLGVQVKSQFFWLAVFSVLTIPVFVVVAMAFSAQCEQHRWVIVVGAGMPAFAASTLLVYSPWFPKLPFQISLTIRIAMTLAILLCGVLSAWWNKNHLRRTNEF